MPLIADIALVVLLYMTIVVSDRQLLSETNSSWH